MSDVEERFNELFGRTHDASITSFGGPVEPSLITEAEGDLGLSFPRTYRLFLERYGVANHGEYSIFGLIDESEIDESEKSFFLGDDIVENNIHSWAKLFDHMFSDRKFLRIANDQDGTSFHLEIRPGSEAEPPVVARSPYFAYRLAAASFLDFIEAIIACTRTGSMFNFID